MRFAGFLCVQILEMPTFCEPCIPLHQTEEQPDTELFLRVVPFYIMLLVGVMGGKKRIVREIGLSSITGRMVLFYLCCSHYLFRLLGCFCISMASLYFFEKYDVILVIMIVLSNSIWCPVSMLCSDNADCVTCFSLTSCQCSSIHRFTIFPVSSMYTCPQEQDILNISFGPVSPTSIGRGID